MERRQEEEQRQAAAAAALQLQQQQQALLHQQTEQLNASLGGQSGLSNEQLAYELILDPFCVLRYSDEQQSCTSLITTNIRQTFPKAFWDKLKQELLTTPPPSSSSSSNDNSSTYAGVFAVLTEILDSVISVCRGWDNDSVRNIAQTIQDILDIDHLKQRVAAGAMPPSDIFSMMSSLISAIKELQMLVTPPSVPSNVFIFRGLYHHHNHQHQQQDLLLQHDHDRSTIQRAKQLQLEAQWTQIITSSQEHFLYNALYHAMERIYILRTDKANKKLRSIAPVLREHGIQYLYNHTARKLQSGEITLQKTEAWVASSLRSIFFSPSSSSSSQHIQDLQQGLRDGRPQAYSFFVDASITLLVATTLELPELLRLDRLRFKALSAHFHTDVMSKVILDTIRSQNLSASTIDSVTDTIRAHAPYPNKPNNTVQLILKDCIPQEHVSAISQLLKDHLTPSHPFYQQAKDSMHEKWLQVVVTQESTTTTTTTPATDTSSNSVVDPPFLPNRHAMDLQNIIRLSKKVYAGTYSRIIRNQMDLLNL